MKDLVGTYDLFNRHRKSFEDAYLYSPIVENHISDFETVWVPAFKARLVEAKTQADVEAANAQDHHWKWGGKPSNAKTVLIGTRSLSSVMGVLRV